MPTDPDPRKPPRNAQEEAIYAWEEIWNGAMEVYKSMPREFADALFMQELGQKMYLRVITQMIGFDDIIPKPLYKPNRDNEDNEDNEDYADNYQTNDYNEEDYDENQDY